MRSRQSAARSGKVISLHTAEALHSSRHNWGGGTRPHHTFRWKPRPQRPDRPLRGTAADLTFLLGLGSIRPVDEAQSPAFGVCAIAEGAAQFGAPPQRPREVRTQAEVSHRQLQVHVRGRGATKSRAKGAGDRIRSLTWRGHGRQAAEKSRVLGLVFDRGLAATSRPVSAQAS